MKSGSAEEEVEARGESVIENNETMLERLNFSLFSAVLQIFNDPGQAECSVAN